MLYDAITFILVMLAAVVAALVWKLGSPLKWRAYFSTPEGRGILLGLALSLLSCEARAGWLHDASVYAGLDNTRKRSPMCDANETDDRLTSNMGVRLNVWQSASEAVRVNSRYTHHSCALGGDDKTYDALGVEIEWKVWER